MSKQVAVWLDHKEARIFHLFKEGFDPEKVTAPDHHLFHTHAPKGSEGTKAHNPETQKFFHDLAHALEGTDALLLMGPASAKTEFAGYLHQHAHTLESKLTGVERSDHPTDKEVVAHARKHFELEKLS